MRPLVSIILPARNTEATIRAAIESIRAQSFTEWELYAIDDHSTDGTGAIIRSMAAADRRILPVLTERGLIPVLNAGQRLAQGRFIARMDADDTCHPERLAAQLEMLREQPEVAAVGCQVDAGAVPPGEGIQRYMDWTNGILTPEDHGRERFVESPLVHPTVMIRWEVLAELGGWMDMGWAEDYDLWLRMLAAGYKIAKVPRCLYNWNDPPDRLTRTDTRYSLANFIACKAYFLSRIPGLRQRGVMLSGGGDTGKAMAKALIAEGVPIHAFIEVAPRRIGTRWNGVPVIGVEDTPRAHPSAPIPLACVGSAAGRARALALLEEVGWRPGVDCWAVS